MGRTPDTKATTTPWIEALARVHGWLLSEGLAPRIRVRCTIGDTTTYIQVWTVREGVRVMDELVAEHGAGVDCALEVLRRVQESVD